MSNNTMLTNHYTSRSNQWRHHSWRAESCRPHDPDSHSYQCTIYSSSPHAGDFNNMMVSTFSDRYLWRNQLTIISDFYLTCSRNWTIIISLITNYNANITWRLWDTGSTSKSLITVKLIRIDLRWQLILLTKSFSVAKNRICLESRRALYSHWFY